MHAAQRPEPRKYVHVYKKRLLSPIKAARSHREANLVNFNQERATKATQQQQKGKLGRGLAKERAQTWDKTLGTVSQDERLRRDTDQATQARNWN